VHGWRRRGKENRKMPAAIIMRSEGKSLEEAYAEPDRQEAEMAAV
jgi:hypothetical protein